MKHGFQYHAFATGLAGRVSRPFEYLIEAQAPSALSPAGGYSSNRVEHFRLKEILSFRAAYTQVAGAFVDEGGRQSWDTVMTSTVEGLNIMGVVTADLIVARLASRHGIRDHQASIIPIGSRIEGLRVAGFPVEIEWDVDLYSHLDTHAKIVSAYKDNENGFRARFDAASLMGQKWNEPAVTDHTRLIATSLASRLTCKSDFVAIHGHVIHLPQFGIVKIGQFLVDGSARQVTMLQVHPECAVGVECAAGSGQTNGEPVPPVPKKP